MIRIVVGRLHDQATEGLLRPIRSDLAPVTPGSRDLGIMAGAAMQERLEQMGPLPVGGAVMTHGGELAAEFVIHAVVSSPDEPESPVSVQKALRNSLRRAADMGIESLALPPLGMGVGTLDAETPARVLLELLYNHLAEARPPLEFKVVASSRYEAEVLEQVSRQLAQGGVTLPPGGP